jgi:hypothetical protein
LRLYSALLRPTSGTTPQTPPSRHRSSFFPYTLLAHKNLTCYTNLSTKKFHKNSLTLQILGRKFPQLLLNYNTKLEAIWSSQNLATKWAFCVDDLLKQTPVGNFAAAHNSTVE